MKSLQWLRLGFTLSVLLVLSGCHSEHDPYGHFRDVDASTLYHKAEHQLAKKDYDGAVHSLEALEILFPFGEHTEQAHLYLLYAYYKNDDMGSAVASSERYIKLYPRSVNTPYAYYIKAMANYHHQQPFLQRLFGQDQAHRDLTLIEESFKDFRLIAQGYPHSAYADQSRHYMVVLLDLLARSEWYAADYYYRRGAYVAAANRALYIVDNYPQSTETAHALALMVKAYRQLHLMAKAEDALEVLHLNFPHSQEYADVMEPPEVQASSQDAQPRKRRRWWSLG